MPEEICVWISDPARRTFRRGHRPWHLTNPVYTGGWVFNKRDSRTQQKPVKEHVTVEVPVIISTAEFDAVAATLKTRDPRVTAPWRGDGADPVDRNRHLPAATGP